MDIGHKTSSGRGNIRPLRQVETAALSTHECRAEGMERRLPGIDETVAARTRVMNVAAAAMGARRRVAVDVVAARCLVLMKRLLWQFGALGERRQRCAGARGQKKQAREPSLHHNTHKFRWVAGREPYSDTHSHSPEKTVARGQNRQPEYYSHTQRKRLIAIAKAALDRMGRACRARAIRPEAPFRRRRTSPTEAREPPSVTDRHRQCCAICSDPVVAGCERRRARILKGLAAKNS